MTPRDVAAWLADNPRGRLEVFRELEDMGVHVNPSPLGPRGEKILRALDRDGRLSTTAISEQAGIRPPLVWSALRLLEARGLVRSIGPAPHHGGKGRSRTLWESVR